jgi:5-formyltetrahydrofolate cyclo-ligase
MNVREQKIELRRTLEAKRRAILGREREAKERTINDKVIAVCRQRLLQPAGTPDAASASSGAVPPGKTSGSASGALRPTGKALFTYMPIRTEADVTPVMRWCWEHGVPVVLSRTDRERKTMSLHRVASLQDLAADTGPWGIREPKASQPELTDLGAIGMILVPGLGFDREFGRLGYGGGFYDRFMQRFEPLGIKRPHCLAAAFDVQIVEHVPLGWHDFRVDEIVTESLHLRRSGAG